MFKKILATLLALFAAAAFAAVDVNKASQAELETIKGIGPAISGRLLEERKKSPFKDWADMVERVKGVGEGNAAKFSTGGLTVNGAAFSGAPAKAATATTATKADKSTAKMDDKKMAATTPTAATATTPAMPAASATDKKAAAAKAKEDKKAAKAAAKASAATDAKK